MKRPIGIVLFALFLAIAAAHALIYVLQFLGQVPAFLGPLGFFERNEAGAMAWGIIALGFLLALAMIWIPAPKGWFHSLIASSAALGLVCVTLAGGTAFRTLLSALIIYSLTSVYGILPSTRKLFK